MPGMRRSPIASLSASWYCRRGRWFSGTALVVAHVEQHWCPSIVSTDITGRASFRFAEDTRGHIGRE